MDHCVSQGCWDSVSFRFAALFICAWSYWPSEWLRCHYTQWWNCHQWKWDLNSKSQQCSGTQMGFSFWSFRLKHIVDDSLMASLMFWSHASRVW